MNLDELRSVQNAERRQSDLQPLRESFYAEAGEYVASLKERRARAADRADDPFSNPEVGRLSDEIDTAEEVIEAIYERRMGKLLTRASLAASEMSADVDGLTTEERDLFHDLVERIRQNKSTVLDTVAGTTGGQSADAIGDRSAGPDIDTDTGIDPGSGATGSDPVGSDPAVSVPEGSVASGVSAADVMGGEDDDGVHDSGPTPGGERPSPTDADPDTGKRSRSPTGEGTAEPPDDHDRVTVRVIRDVGEIVGVDDREYELTGEDVVDLPAKNAEPLLERDAAERLEPRSRGPSR